jgi:hypothetical protein
MNMPLKILLCVFKGLVIKGFITGYPDVTMLLAPELNMEGPDNVKKLTYMSWFSEEMPEIVLKCFNFP